MIIALHKNARTTPAIRTEIAVRTLPAQALAQRFGITEATVSKWKKRTDPQDRSHTAIKANKSAASAQSFLKALHKACPLKITRVLTDNGKEFMDRLFASRARQPSGNHQLCQALGIEHRLIQPRTPRTNSMARRFNGRISDVLKTDRFNSALDLEQTLLRYIALYNHQLPQSALKSQRRPCKP